MTRYTFHESPLGKLLLISVDDRLAGVYFTDGAHVPEIERDWVRDDGAGIFGRVREQLSEYVAGSRMEFELALAEGTGTPFQLKVWEEMGRIPFGKTMSYAELARRIGAPRAVRAVGAAAGRNPLCWIVPCHRVVGGDGSLAGYAGGLWRKRRLLDFEAGRVREWPVLAAAA